MIATVWFPNYTNVLHKNPLLYGKLAANQHAVCCQLDMYSNQVVQLQIIQQVGCVGNIYRK
jgi:hypothetical protein